jgi:quinoprotein glucose dehydrogenase
MMQTHTDDETLAAPPYVFSSLLIVIGIALFIGGAELASLGGSLYYVLAGTLNVAAGILLWRRSKWGERVYTAVLLGSLAWALWEVGLAPWGLVPRVTIPAALGLWLLVSRLRRCLGKGHGACAFSHAGWAAVLCFAVVAIAFLRPQWTRSPYVLPPAVEDKTADGNEWRHYGNTLRGTRFSPLTQINTANVAQLQVAWTYRSGDAPNRMSAAESNPLKIGDTLYTCTPNNVIVALDAESGALRWRHDPRNEPGFYAIRTCRGVAYYQSPTEGGECQARIIAGTIDSRLIALDAKSGNACKDFGVNGVVSLRDNIGSAELSYIFATSPATIIKGHVIVGAMVLDNQSIDMPSGVIRSFDPVSGRLQWAWDMGAPDRAGAPPAGQTYTRSTPNAWGIFAADEELGLVYVPTGNPSPDFWGPKRRPFDEKYGSSIVALDIDTGRPRWSFQTVHHDLWDYDVASQPSLVDLPTAEGRTPALIQATKRGDIYVLDRRTGIPIVPVVERDVPQGAAPGDWLSKTQPFSQLALPSIVLTEASMWGATPFDQMICRIKFRQSRYDGIFTPPGTMPTIIVPGLIGGVDWGSVSIDVDRNILIANYMLLPWRGRLIPRAEVTKNFAAAPLATLAKGAPFAWDYTPWLSPIGLPCSQPPWGALAAIDLGTNRVLWNEPLGTGEDSGPLNIPSKLPLTMGTPNMGGTLTTRGGLVFVSGTLDRYIRAFDLGTGKELWKARIPAGGQATPMTYMADGRQFIVVTVGGHMILQTKFGDYTIAYALPKH